MWEKEVNGASAGLPFVPYACQSGSDGAQTIWLPTCLQARASGLTRATGTNKTKWVYYVRCLPYDTEDWSVSI